MPCLPNLAVVLLAQASLPAASLSSAQRHRAALRAPHPLQRRTLGCQPHGQQGLASRVSEPSGHKPPPGRSRAPIAVHRRVGLLAFTSRGSVVPSPLPTRGTSMPVEWLVRWRLQASRRVTAPGLVFACKWSCRRRRRKSLVVPRMRDDPEVFSTTPTQDQVIHVALKGIHTPDPASIPTLARWWEPTRLSPPLPRGPRSEGVQMASLSVRVTIAAAAWSISSRRARARLTSPRR